MRKRNILARVIAVSLVGIITTPVLAKATLEPVTLARPIPAPTLPAEAQKPPRGFLPANANPLSYSLTQIATAWTRWAFGTAAPNNPLLSVRCEQSTLNPRIWFLPPSIDTALTNTCEVPEGTFLALSPAGYECSEAEGNGSTTSALLACVDAGFPLLTHIEVTLNGITTTNLSNYIITTPFDVLPPDNLFGPNPTPSITRGYFLIVEPLSRGVHVLHALDEFSSLGLKFGITYTILVR